MKKEIGFRKVWGRYFTIKILENLYNQKHQTERCINQKKLKAHTITTIILYEVDSLLSGNNVSVVKDIIKTTLRDRQLLGFSASLNEIALDILNNVMKEPEVIKIDEEPINPNINHMYLHGDRRDKFTLLRKAIAATNPKRAIVFVNDEDSI